MKQHRNRFPPREEPDSKFRLASAHTDWFPSDIGEELPEPQLKTGIIRKIAKVALTRRICLTGKVSQPGLDVSSNLGLADLSSDGSHRQSSIRAAGGNRPTRKLG